MSQHENYDISEMREYFCTKFCSFVYKTTVDKYAAFCCMYLTYAKLTKNANFSALEMHKMFDALRC